MTMPYPDLRHFRQIIAEVVFIGLKHGSAHSSRAVNAQITECAPFLIQLYTRSNFRARLDMDTPHHSLLKRVKEIIGWSRC